MIKAIFWDFDGTLVHSNDLWAKGMYAALLDETQIEVIGYEAILERKNNFGYPWHLWEKDYTHINTSEKWWAYMEEIFVKTFIASGAEEKIALNAAKHVRGHILSRECYTIFSDSVPALEMTARLGYKNYILSNNYPELREVLDALDLTKYFEEIIVSGEFGYEKPRQEIFDYAKKIANNPEIGFMIGDNPRADAEGGNEAGLITILVRKICEHKAKYFLPDLSGLEEILKRYE